VGTKRAVLDVSRRYWPLWLVVVPLAVWALVRAFGLEGDSSIVALLAFTPYAAIAAFLLAGICVALRNWAAAILTVLAFATLAIAVLPRAFGEGEKAPPGSASLRVMSANLHLGHADAMALVALVEDQRPDLLFVQEMSRAESISQRRAGIRRFFPDAVLSVPTRGFGRGIYSRRPLNPLPLPDANPGLMPPVSLSLPGGGSIRAIDVHPHPPYPGKEAAWGRALRALPSGGVGAPWLLIGDFNATLDDAELRDVLGCGYRDAATVTGSGLEPTWPSGYPLPPLITIDHVLADSRLGIADYGVADLPGSDHKAIQATVFLPPAVEGKVHAR
jgi:endonuclease/exonuclease/phosphatase (EEP) superfamily protein YafD